MQYFEKREKSSLGDAFDRLYSMPEQICRGLTVNEGRCQKEKIAKAITGLVPSPFCKASFIVKDDNFRPGRHPYHHAGAFYMQEPSAAAPAEILDVNSGDYVLDVCAAPGGKAAQLSAALDSGGLLVCNELVPARACVLKSNMERIGAQNAVILNTEVKNIAASLPLFFNKILVDAPCSGEGMFRKEPFAAQQHSEALVLSCAALGADILSLASQCLAPGGTMVYSTCTFSGEENEAQIGAFLQRHKDFYIEPINVEFGSEGEPTRCNGYEYNAEYARRIYPCHGAEGHFMAKLRRKGTEPIKQFNSIRQPKKQKPSLCYSDFIGAYFGCLINADTIQIGDTIYILPKEMLPPLQKLHVICAGVPAGNIVKGRFEPSHSLFMAYGTLCDNRECLTLEDERTAAWLHGAEIQAKTAQKGYAAVLVDGLPLGFGKVSGGVIKNHYPKGLRNLK